MFKANFTAIVLASALSICLGTSNRAQAGFHHWANAYYGAPYCLVPGPGSAPGFWACGCCAAPVYRVHHCHLFHACCLKHRAWWYGCGGSCGTACGGGCWDGCGSCGGCAGGISGCSACASGATTSSQEYGNEGVIYDGPARGGDPQPADPIDTRETRNSAGVRYRLTSSTTATPDGSAEFERGLGAFRSRSFNDALVAFDSAIAAEPGNALYRYYRAMSLFELQGPEAASDALAQAIETERDQPVANWGKRMERVQGRGRLWVETARRAAMRQASP